MAKRQAPNVNGLEQSLKALEALVERLESGDLPLEEALKEFEQGVKLTRACQAILKDAEQKVEILLKKTESAEAEPFEPEAAD
jgi:exodeoxyribonuclease VII small subunit